MYSKQLAQQELSLWICWEHQLCASEQMIVEMNYRNLRSIHQLLKKGQTFLHPPKMLMLYFTFRPENETSYWRLCLWVPLQLLVTARDSTNTAVAIKAFYTNNNLDLQEVAMCTSICYAWKGRQLLDEKYSIWAPMLRPQRPRIRRCMGKRHS